jgi:hypothetical protein
VVGSAFLLALFLLAFLDGGALLLLSILKRLHLLLMVLLELRPLSLLGRLLLLLLMFGLQRRSLLHVTGFDCGAFLRMTRREIGSHHGRSRSCAGGI